MKLARHAPRMRREEVYTRFWCANMRERDHSEDPDVDERIVKHEELCKMKASVKKTRGTIESLIPKCQINMQVHRSKHKTGVTTKRQAQFDTLTQGDDLYRNTFKVIFTERQAAQ
jgi:hypothetical protein